MSEQNKKDSYGNKLVMLTIDNRIGAVEPMRGIF